MGRQRMGRAELDASQTRGAQLANELHARRARIEGEGIADDAMYELIQTVPLPRHDFRQGLGTTGFDGRIYLSTVTQRFGSPTMISRGGTTTRDKIIASR